MKFQSSETVWFAMKKYIKKIEINFVIDVQNVKYLSRTYFCFNSIKIEN